MDPVYNRHPLRIALFDHLQRTAPFLKTSKFLRGAI
jgi:hypothetical protein